MSRIASLYLYFQPTPIETIGSILLHSFFDQGATIVLPDGTKCTNQDFDTHHSALFSTSSSKILLNAYVSQAFFVKLEQTCFFMHFILRNNTICVHLSIRPPAWCRPHPYCDEYIDWERYSKLVLDAPIAAPLVGITTFDTEYLS